MKPKYLEANGEMDYDYVNDILFFKIKDREYSRSIEFENLVLDIDTENFITGIQIFDASKFLQVDKESLRVVPKWELKAIIDRNKIEIRLNYKTHFRNMIIEKNPIIIQENRENLPSSMVVCEV